MGSIDGQMGNDCTSYAAHFSNASHMQSPISPRSTVSSRHVFKCRRNRKQPLHLFLTTAAWALCLFILAGIPPTTSAQPNGNDRRTNEDFLFDLANAPIVDLTPFQIRLFASEGRNLQLSEGSITAVRKETQRYVDDHLRELYTEQGYQFDFVRLEVLDSSVVVRTASNNGGGRARRRDRRTLRGRRSLHAVPTDQRTLQDDNGGDEGTAITLGGEVTFVDRPVPEQWKIESNFLSAIRHYDDLREALLTSEDPALRLVDTVEVKSMASVQQEQDLSVIEGGKDVLPSWMGDVVGDIDGGKGEEKDIEGNQEAVGDDNDKDNDVDTAEVEDDNENDLPTEITPSIGGSDQAPTLDEGPNDYPKGTAVSAEKGPPMPTADPSGGTSTATIAIIVLAVLLGLAFVAALAILLIKRRNARSDELINKWTVGDDIGYDAAISPTATGESGGSNVFANEDHAMKAVHVASGTLDAAGPAESSENSPNDPTYSSASTLKPQSFARGMSSPGIGRPDAVSPTASGSQQTHAAPQHSHAPHNVSDPEPEEEGNNAVKMRSLLASGVSRLPPTPHISEQKVVRITPLLPPRDRARSCGTKSTCSQDEIVTNNVATVRPNLSTNDSLNSGSRPPMHLGPTAGAFPTSAPGSHYVSRNSLRSFASSSYQTSVDGEAQHSGAYPGFPHNGIDALHPMDWSCRGSETEGEDGEAESVGNSTLTTECPPDAKAGAYPALPASLLDGAGGGRVKDCAAADVPTVPASFPNNADHESDTDRESPRNLSSPQTRETSSDLLSPSTGTGTMTSRGSSTARSGEGANQLIKDLLWLEGKLADVRASKARDTTGGDQNHAALFSPVGKTSGNRDPYKDREAKRRKDTQSIVCRDCFAPPGKLHIVIHTTKDGPAVHSIREGSALEGHLFPEDLIVAVDDVDTRSYPAEEVIKMLSDKMDSERKITVLHFEDNGQ